MVAVAAAGAAYANPLHKHSTGADWRGASDDEKVAWAATAATVVESNRLKAALLGVQIKTCLDEAMTSRSNSDDAAVAVLKNQKLADMTVMCAILISAQ